MVAGGALPTAARLGAGMLALQAAIGALNDLLDAPSDAGRKLGKPIPAGLVSPAVATGVAAGSAGAGLALTIPSGVPTVLVATLILAIGGIYDLRLKGTAWSWLPFAVGIPLLPVYAWLGTTGRLPGAFVVLLPAACLAGAALAIANALADVERDRAAGVGSVAEGLGPRTAWRLHAVLLGSVLALAGGSAATLGLPLEAVLGIVAAPAGLLVLGAALAAHRSASRRERGWELEVLGIAVLAVTWLTFGLPHWS
jgi:4-hydroxybenzoate polyprenyltransferase